LAQLLEERSQMRVNALLFSLLIASFVIMLSAIHVDTRSILPMKASFNALTNEAQKQISCLAENIYFEAKSEPKEGKIAVAFVTLNRLRTGNYADTICGVVTQKTNGVCQFSWYCDSSIASKRLTIKNSPVYNDILEMSTYLYLNIHRVQDVTNGATFYHADYVNPGWQLKKEKQIGRHIFYKRNGDQIDRNKTII
jgi:spore germination cell wall hydrolase CwlJ-like protein